jgi:hypothetical protein
LWLLLSSPVVLVWACSRRFGEPTRPRRILLVERGQWRDHPIRRAMVLGDVDGYVFVPWQREQWLYLPMSEYLAAWSRTQAPEIHAVTVVGPRWHNRSHQLRDMFSRASIPFVFYEPDTEEGREALGRMGLDRSRLPAVQLATGKALADPTDSQIMERLGFRSELSNVDCDVAIVGAGPAGLSAAVYGGPQRVCAPSSSTPAYREDRPGRVRASETTSGIPGESAAPSWPTSRWSSHGCSGRSFC